MADRRAKRVGNGLRGNACRLGEHLGDALDRDRRDETGDAATIDACLGERSPERGDGDAAKALVAHPARLPIVIGVLSALAEMIDEIERAAVAGDQAGDARAGAGEDGGRGIPGEHLALAGGGGDGAFGGDVQRRFARRCGIERGDQRGGAGALAAARIERAGGIGEVERLLDDAGVLAVGKDMGGGGEGDAVGRAGAVREQIARGLDRHGDHILVPVGHSLLALGEAAQSAGEPAIGGVDRTALQAGARDIGAEAVDAGVSHWPLVSA